MPSSSCCRDNALGTLYNIVGFQTKMKYGAQTDVFRRIPGLQNASFARLGGIHRNTFPNSPRLIDDRLRLRARPNLRFAGQVTGSRAASKAPPWACLPDEWRRRGIGARPAAAARHDLDGGAGQSHHRRCGCEKPSSR